MATPFGAPIRRGDALPDDDALPDNDDEEADMKGIASLETGDRARSPGAGLAGRGKWTSGIAAAAGAVMVGALLLVPGAAEGQDRLMADVRGGVGIPFGDLGDLLDSGPSLGIGGALEVVPRFRLRVDGDVQFLDGAGFTAVEREQPRGPDINLWQFTFGLDYQFNRPGITRWVLTVNGGLGLTNLSSDPFPETVNPQTGETVTEFDETYFTMKTGGRAAFQVTPEVRVFGQVDVNVVFSDSPDVAVFTQMSGADVSATGSLWSLPVRAGVEIGLY